jgi:Rod binding domain-containing protein
MSRVPASRAAGSQVGSSTSSTSSASLASSASSTSRPPSASQNLLAISASDPPEVQKLKRAAAEFEGMLLAKWWSSMKDSGLGAADDSTDAGHDTLDAMGIQAMSGAVASRGGLGIGAMLVRSLLSNAQASAAENSPAPAPDDSNGS